MENVEKMNCDIIRDLIPSYVDEVCSQTTKECVEAHLEECGECRLIAARCRDNALSGEKLEQKSLDGLNRINNILTFQRLACYGSLLLMLYCGIQMFLAKRAGYVLFDFLLLWEILCLLFILGIGIKQKEIRSPGKRAWLLGAASLALDLYFILLLHYFFTHLKPDVETIFGMELYKTGPFLEKQLAAAFIVQIAFFLYNLWCTIVHHRNCSWLLCLNISGIFLTIACNLLMYRMDSYETLKIAFRQTILEVMIPGMLGIIVSLVISRRIRKTNR